MAIGTDPNLSGGSEKPLVEAAGFFMGPLAGVLAAGAAISTIGFSTGAALGGPRYLYALGATGRFPKFLLEAHPRFATPYMAIVINTLSVLVLALGMDFIRLVDLTNIAIATQYLATCAAAWRLLKKPFLPLAGMGAVLWLSSQAKMEEVFAGFVAIGLGYLLSLICLWRRQIR